VHRRLAPHPEEKEREGNLIFCSSEVPEGYF
jgi:hypothetical protein